MAVTDLSVVNSDFTMKIGDRVFTIDNFSPESDMWVVDSQEIGDLLVTPDGQGVKNTKQSPTIAHLTLNAGSALAEVLFEVARLSQRKGERKPKMFDISVYAMSLNGNIEAFTGGTMTNSPMNHSYGVDKKKDVTFDFKFLDTDSTGTALNIM